jgi:hypothetical protein
MEPQMPLTQVTERPTSLVAQIPQALKAMTFGSYLLQLAASNTAALDDVLDQIGAMAGVK